MKTIITATILFVSTSAIAECVTISGKVYCSQPSNQGNLINQLLETYSQPSSYPVAPPTYIYQQNRDGSTTIYQGVAPGNYNPPTTDWINSKIVK